ncbi:MAG: hypothetical protein P4L87_14310 [Formivibrio sp.]|nr:hypothetical protein [Formivibrio sp.]
MAIALATKLLPIRTLVTISGVLKTGALCVGRKPKANAVSWVYPSIFDSHKPLAVNSVTFAYGMSQLGLHAYG